MKADEYISGILSGDRVRLAQALTLVESNLDQDRHLADEILNACLSHSGNSQRIAISGAPGVGKSTFIEAYGIELIEQGHRIAVLAIDPSSQNTGGSILGDKTRMQKLSSHEMAFIRPSPAADALGGVAHRTRESILLCEAAGYTKILIETVGVGQSEIAAAHMSDLYMVLVLAGAGDELQGIKRGIIEMADILIVHKADGENIEAAKRARQSYLNALHLYPAKSSGQNVDVRTHSSMNDEGIAGLHNAISKYFEAVQQSGYFEEKRKQQVLHWLDDALMLEIRKKYMKADGKYLKIREKVASGELHPTLAAKLITS